VVGTNRILKSIAQSTVAAACLPTAQSTVLRMRHLQRTHATRGAWLLINQINSPVALFSLQKKKKSRLTKTSPIFHIFTNSVLSKKIFLFGVRRSSSRGSGASDGRRPRAFLRSGRPDRNQVRNELFFVSRAWWFTQSDCRLINLLPINSLIWFTQMLRLSIG
jgi:hypothetical protein